MTLHTASGCGVSVGDGGQSGTSGNTNCNANNAYDGMSLRCLSLVHFDLTGHRLWCQQ